MSNSADLSQIPCTSQAPPKPPGDLIPVVAGDPQVALLNLSTVRARMDTLQRFLSESINNNTLVGKDQMNMVSTEISSAIHQIFINGAALLACTAAPNPPPTATPSSIKVAETDLKFSERSNDFEVNSMSSSKEKVAVDTKIEEEEKVVLDMKIEEEEMNDEVLTDDCEIIELDSVELLAEHIHFCDICGKGFKRDANLRMHMRAHGNQYKTMEALAKPEKITPELSMRKTRFSCPFVGCNRNKSHQKFRPLKSAICVKNHFKRSHCPKMYSCNRCNKKSFSVVADLKSHLKHCGESKWKCSCGTTFSRKDKLFGHMALFEGHMPAVVDEDDKARGAAAAGDDEEGEDLMEEGAAAVRGANCADNNDGFFDGLLEEFGSIDGYCLQDVLESPTALGSSVNQFFNFQHHSAGIFGTSDPYL